ncbi:alpha/beta fold hydrolase [Geoglobus acetivorans]|uniref:Alpha/beta hydrolase n=1 Tax=Geoglobus acetivorans TaxID=565033 RepID=A0ABZ3H0Z6_GEOAI|nr:alpha/beta hydrolase [Geoglobus acetivorans]
MAERIRIDVNGKAISVLKGKERNLFYIHSSGSDAEQWKYQLEAVGGYAIDLPNHGESYEAEIKSIDDYAFYVSETVKKTCGKAVITGHSLGGAVAQKVCVNYPELCIGLVLVGTGARLRVLPEILDELESRPDNAIEKILEMGFFRKGDEYWRMREKYLKNSEVLHLDLMLCDKFDMLEDYRSGKVRIEVPVLIVVGAEDRLTPVKYAEFFKNHIENSKLVVIDSASHMVMVEKPDEFNSVLKAFLTDIIP